MSGVNNSVAAIRRGCVSFVAMYAAVQIPTFAAALVGCHPKRIAAQNPTHTAKNSARYTTTAIAPYSTRRFFRVFRTAEN